MQLSLVTEVFGNVFPINQSTSRGPICALLYTMYNGLTGIFCKICFYRRERKLAGHEKGQEEGQSKRKEERFLHLYLEVKACLKEARAEGSGVGSSRGRQ
jgi:hypothetical protein